MTFGKPKKSLGQNFLIQPNIVSKIIFEAGLGISDDCPPCPPAGAVRAPEGSRLEPETVLEVGPGRGVLTRALLDTGARVIAVEKDDALFTELHGTFAKEISEKKLILVHGDILELLSRQGESLPSGEGLSLLPSSFTVVANIPYYITGELLRRMLSGKVQPRKMTLMVQKEVASRICGEPRRLSSGARTAPAGGQGGQSSVRESLLSISVKAYGTPRYAGTVGKGNFYPVPKVDSAILSIENISKNFFQHLAEEKFFAVLHAGFAHKRKLLLNNLSSLAPKQKLTELFLERNLSLKIRAEELTLADWGYLVERL